VHVRKHLYRQHHLLLIASSVWLPDQLHVEIRSELSSLELYLRTAEDFGPPNDSARFALGAGYPGVALFFLYHFLSFGTPGDAADIIEHAMSKAAEAASAHPRIDLFQGLVGHAWISEHIALLTNTTSDVDEQFDRDLISCVERFGSGMPNDLIAGLVGLGVYGLERLKMHSATASPLIASIVALLEQKARIDRDTVTWVADPGVLPRDLDAQLGPAMIIGLAHGIPGIVSFLVDAYRAGFCRNTIEYLVDGALRWIMRQESATGEFFRFPHVVTKERRLAEHSSREVSRIAWCYGDLSVAVAVIKAGKALGRPDWCEFGVRIARAAAGRPFAETGIVDTGICHGAAGVAHIWSVLFAWTGESEFSSAALFWYTDTLRRLRERTTTGIQSYQRPSWYNDAGFLTGASGAALVLTAAVSDVPPRWSRLLLTWDEE
jgi:hypothetical protein